MGTCGFFSGYSHTLQSPTYSRSLRDGRGIKQCEFIVQTPVVGPGLLAAARHVENEAEDLLAYLLNRGLTCSNAPGIDVDQIGPSVCQRGAGRHLDHRSHGKSVGGSTASGEDMNVH